MFVKARDDWTGEEKYINLNYCRVIEPYGEESFQAVIDDGYDKDTFYIIEEESETEKVREFLGIEGELKMATYKIETNVTDEMIEEMRKYHFFLDNEIDKERFEGLKSLREDPKVSSLEDYWELLEKVSFITDGEYSIHNQGRYIELWD